MPRKSDSPYSRCFGQFDSSWAEFTEKLYHEVDHTHHKPEIII
jgi:hypothetical protein